MATVCVCAATADRTTTIGQMINAYLTNATELDDHTIHLLFSANRWERHSAIVSALSEGTHIVMDRYAPSGTAFSGAKDGMTLEWCKQSDAGLPAPDKVFFLDVPPEVAAARGGFGGERYEVAPFQAKVRENFDKLMVRAAVLFHGVAVKRAALILARKRRCLPSALPAHTLMAKIA